MSWRLSEVNPHHDKNEREADEWSKEKGSEPKVWKRGYKALSSDVKCESERDIEKCRESCDYRSQCPSTDRCSEKRLV